MKLDPRIKLRHLQCFFEAATQRNVSRAAERLSITQPAASKTIRELEDILGVRLLARAKNGVKLTTHGEVFQRHVAAGLAALRQGFENLRLQGTPQTISIGVLPNVAATTMPAAVGMFKAQHSDVNVQIITGSNAALLSLLRLGELDLVIGRLAEPGQMMGLSFEHLYSERITIVVRPAHPLADRKRFGLPELAGYTAILPTPSTVIRQEVDRYLTSQGIASLPNFIETISVTFGRAFTLASDAVWFVPRGVVEKDLSAGMFRELLSREDVMQGPVGLTYRSQAALPAPIEHLCKLVREIAAERRADNQVITDGA